MSELYGACARASEMDKDGVYSGGTNTNVNAAPAYPGTATPFPLYFLHGIRKFTAEFTGPKRITEHYTQNKPAPRVLRSSIYFIYLCVPFCIRPSLFSAPIWKLKRFREKRTTMNFVLIFFRDKQA